MALFSVSKIFEPSGENPYCAVMNSFKPRVLLFT